MSHAGDHDIIEEVDGEARCQYCDLPRTHRGYFGCSPVSLCSAHRLQHGGDLDRCARVFVRRPAAATPSA